MTNFDPQQFSTVNFPLIKNLYDSLLEYTPDGKAVPSLATGLEDRARQHLGDRDPAQGREVPQRRAASTPRRSRRR